MTALSRKQTSFARPPCQTVAMTWTAKRPSVNEVRLFLASRNALIVHFSGCPKGAGFERGHVYPADLQHVLAREAQGGLAASVVMPGDRFAADFSHCNSTGCIGVILDLNSPESLVAVSPHDCGSRDDHQGTREVLDEREITLEDLEQSISLRPRGGYNEWVVKDFRVIGIFAYHPFMFYEPQPVPRLPDMPEYLLHDAPEFGPSFTTLAEIRQTFPSERLYTFAFGSVVEVIATESLYAPPGGL